MSVHRECVHSHHIPNLGRGGECGDGGIKCIDVTLVDAGNIAIRVTTFVLLTGGVPFAQVAQCFETLLSGVHAGERGWGAWLWATILPAVSPRTIFAIRSFASGPLGLEGFVH